MPSRTVTQEAVALTTLWLESEDEYKKELYKHIQSGPVSMVTLICGLSNLVARLLRDLSDQEGTSPANVLQRVSLEVASIE